jgi:hypothetical protein
VLGAALYRISFNVTDKFLLPDIKAYHFEYKKIRAGRL